MIFVSRVSHMIVSLICFTRITHLLREFFESLSLQNSTHSGHQFNHRRLFALKKFYRFRYDNIPEVVVKFLRKQRNQPKMILKHLNKSTHPQRSKNAVGTDNDTGRLSGHHWWTVLVHHTVQQTITEM